MVESAKYPTIVYTDHAAIVSIARQTNLTTTTSTNKFNLQLIRTSRYLQQFNLNVYHKPEKMYIVSNALSRLVSCKNRIKQSDKRELNALATFLQKIQTNLATLVELSSSFKEKLKNSYKNNPCQKRIKSIIIITIIWKLMQSPCRTKSLIS